MSWPMQNTGPWNPGMVMGPDMSMGSYTPEQWAAIQQQNWQWTQWQQQYAQWQSQYGEKYAEQMQAIQAMGSNMPPLPPASAPPAPPPPDKPPPPPPHENNQPLFGHPPSQPAPVPAPNVTQQNVNSGNINLGNQQANNSNRSFPQASTADSVNAEALKKLAEEERLFDIQFQKWEEEIEKWRKDNVNHPDKQAYKEYEEKFEACRAQLLERRQQMNKKKARLLEGGAAPQPPQSANTVVATNVNTFQPPPVQKPLQQNYGNKSTQNLNNESNFGVNTSNYMSQNIPYQQQYTNPPIQNAYNKGNNMSKDNGKYHNDQYPKDSFSGPPSKPSFLLASESNKKGIPGLDLVAETDKFALKSRSGDVIDITEDNKPQAPDYTKISKGINNILGDEKIMNILSMVRGQAAPGSLNNPPPSQPVQSGNYTGNNQTNTYNQGRTNLNYSNQQFDNRQNNIQHNSTGGFPMQSDQQQGHRLPPPIKKNVEEQISQNQYNDYDSNVQYGGNNMGQSDRGFPPSRPNMAGPPPLIRPLLQGMSGQNNYPRGVSNSGQQTVNDFSRGPPAPNDFSRGPPGPNDFSRGPPGPNDFSRGPPGPNDFSRGTPGSNDFSSGGMGANDYSRGVPPPNDFTRGMDQQNISDYNRQGYGQHNDYSRGQPGQQPIQEYSKAPPGQAERLPLNAINNIAPIASQPARPKWVDEPMFTPSVIVEYEHKPLRLKARDFIEPVHMFDYNHKSKDDDGKKKDFEKEVGEIYSRKPNRFDKEPDYGGDRYTRDYHSRDFERRVPRVQDLDDYRSRGPPRDDYDDRRRLDDDRRKFDDDRKRLDSRFDDRRRDDRDKFSRREEIYRDYDRDYHRDRGRDSRRDDNRRDDRRDDNRRDDIRKDDNRRDDVRRDDRRDDTRRDDMRRDGDRRDDIRRDDSRRNERRDDSRNRSRSRDRDSRKRGLSKDNDSDASSKRAKDKEVVPAKSFEQPKCVVMIDDLLELPGREMRPEKIVVILRGPPGSGKSFLAKLIRDKEAEHGGTVRIMSIDDYFMQEGEIEEQDPTTGKMVKKPTLKYEYDEENEEAYTNSLKRAFKRCLTDGYFSFVIYDAVNDTLKSYADIWNLARQNDFQAYVCTMELDPQLCYKRNIHNRKLTDIEVICARFYATPPQHIQLDATTLLQSGAITEVHMEDADDMEVVMEDAQEPEVENVFTSKWEMMDDAVQLARLDGTSKPLRSSQLSMEDYLQLDDWKPTTAKPGKKTVRWADIEERRQQEKMRAIGFVVGQTDWNRMTDPTMGSSALTQTKYIERVRRH